MILNGMMKAGSGPTAPLFSLELSATLRHFSVLSDGGRCSNIIFGVGVYLVGSLKYV